MASKTRAILLAVVLLSAGLAGCADTDDTDTTEPDTDPTDPGTGDGDPGDTDDTDDRGDTGERDTRMEDYDNTFEDTIDEEGYQRNWTFPVNETGANISIEANLQGDAVDDFEATLWDADDEELCTVSDDGTDDVGGIGDDGNSDSECERDAETTGDYTLTVWGNSTMDEADYTINVTVAYQDTGQQDDGNTTDDGVQDDGTNGYSIARTLGT